MIITFGDGKKMTNEIGDTLEC